MAISDERQPGLTTHIGWATRNPCLGDE